MRNKYSTVHAVLHYTGLILISLGFLLLIPLLFVLIGGEIKDSPATLLAFLLPSVISFSLGLLFKRVFHESRIYTLRAMLICTLCWISCSAIGALPFVIGVGAGYLDAFFETMSGFTTTGITMFSSLDLMPKSILFWRSFMQWLGGLGILTLFLFVGYKGSGAHALFGAESHKIEVERPAPSLQNTLKILWGIYGGFTLLIFVGLLAAGMGSYDSLCHCLTTLATGGYSPHDASIAFYRLNGYTHYRLIEYIIIIGMLMGGINFLIHFRVLRRNVKALFDNSEIKLWWGIIGICTLVILIERLVRIEGTSGMPITSAGFLKKLEENFRIVLFQVTSLLTTTGFATRNIGGAFFGNAAKQIFLIFMVIGGCVGSTSGGIKVLRVFILFKLVKRELFRLRTPRHTASSVLIDGRPVGLNEIQRVGALLFAWIILIIIGGAITALLSNHSPLSAFSGMFSALGNIGPCYIPAKEMSELNAIVKVTYIIGMLAGRLEILPVLILLNPRAWRY